MSERIRDNPDALKITLNTILLYIIAQGIKAAPYINSLLEYSNLTRNGCLKICKNINICIPMMIKAEDNNCQTGPTTIGVVVPKLEEKTIDDIALYTQDLQRCLQKTNVEELMFQVAAEETAYDFRHGHLGLLPRILSSFFGKGKVKLLKGKAKKAYYALPETERLVASDVSDASIWFTNIGPIYPKMRGRLTMAIMMPPTVLCFGVGVIQRQPGVYRDANGEEQIGIRSILPFLFIVDYRAFDGIDIFPFIQRIDEIFDHPWEFFELVEQNSAEKNISQE